MPAVKDRGVLPDFAQGSRLLSKAQTCNLLNISRTQLWRLTKKKELHLYPIGRGQYKFDELLWYLEKIKE